MIYIFSMYEMNDFNHAHLCSAASSIVATRTRGIHGGFPTILNNILFIFLSFSKDTLDASE